MLNLQRQTTHETVLDKQGFVKTDTRIEIEVGHRHGVLQHVPEHFLCVIQIEISAPREGAFREFLGYGNLELDVGVVFGRFIANRGPNMK